MVRLFRAFDPTPMLDRPGGHLAVHSFGEERRPPGATSIRPSCFGLKDLIRKL